MPIPIETMADIEDHPLISGGALPCPSQHHSKLSGVFYNPVVDAIVMDRGGASTDADWNHEAIHRFSSFESGGFEALRRLSGISHSLLFALLGIADGEQARLLGTHFSNLDLRIEDSAASWASQIPDRLRQIEYVIDRLLYSLAPVAEFAAIDFTPRDGNLSWMLRPLPDDGPNRMRKERQVRAVAGWLSNNSPHFNGKSQSEVQKIILGAWNLYKRVPDFMVREVMLRVTMGRGVQIRRDGNELLLASVDTLAILETIAPFASSVQAFDLFLPRLPLDMKEMRKSLRMLEQTVFEGLPGNEGRIQNLALLVNDILSNSAPIASNQFYEGDNIGDSPPPGGHLRESLLHFRRTRDRGPEAIVNRKHLEMASTLAGWDDVEKPDDGFGRLDIRENWWRALVALETLRGCLKKGLAYRCPFATWKGVSCASNCGIRMTGDRLKAVTSIPVESPLCSY